MYPAYAHEGDPPPPPSRPARPQAAEVPGIATIDLSSGVETDKVKDFWKIRTVTRLIKNRLPAYFGPFGGQFVPEILLRPRVGVGHQLRGGGRRGMKLLVNPRVLAFATRSKEAISQLHFSTPPNSKRFYCIFSSPCCVCSCIGCVVKGTHIHCLVNPLAVNEICKIHNLHNCCI